MVYKRFSAIALGTVMIFTIILGINRELKFVPVQPVKAAGVQAQEFSLENLNGKQIQLSHYKGERVLINFWATWCPPCRAEMPAMQELYEKYKDRIEFLAINIDPENDVKGYVNEMKLTFPILLDKTGAVNERYGIISIPTTLLVDEKGTIIKKQIGAMNSEQLKEFIESP